MSSRTPPRSRPDLPSAQHFAVPPLSPALSDRPRGGIFKAELDMGARRALSDTSDSDTSDALEEPRPAMAHSRQDSDVLDTSSAPSVPPRSASLHQVGSSASPRMAASVRDFTTADERMAPRAPRTHIKLSADSHIQPPDFNSVASHLPNIPMGSTDPTSLANWDVDAQRRFREYLEVTPGGDPHLLDLYNDVVTFVSLSTKLRAACQSIEDVYLVKDSPNRLALPISIRGPILDSLHKARLVGTTMVEPQKELLASLFNTDFQSYMQKKLVEHAVARLGSWGVAAGTGDGLADCFCLTNPRLRDHPIVLASDGFASLTGYSLDTIVGRNCRFLQGPGTSPESVLRLRNALNAGESITSLLLNYRRDGTPFFNLLCMLPLKDATGAVKYFLGGQIDCTADMPVLLGTAPQPSDGTTTPRRSATRSKLRFTPTVQARSDSLIADPFAPTPKASDASGLRRRESQSTIGSSHAGGSVRGAGAISNGAMNSGGGSGFGAKRGPARKSGKGSELGLTPEEHADLHREAPFEGKIADFEATYSRVVLIHKVHGTILFATPGLAAFCGLPASTADDLVGTEFVKIIAGASKDVAQRLRRNIKTAIDHGHSYSLAVGVQIKPAARTLSLRKREKSEFKKCFLHLTPLSDKDGVVEAFVAVFGAVA